MGELYRLPQKSTAYVYLDRAVQYGLSWGLCGSVWHCPELSRTKGFADQCCNYLQLVEACDNNEYDHHIHLTAIVMTAVPIHTMTIQ